MRQLKITKSITNRESASLDKYLQEHSCSKLDIEKLIIADGVKEIPDYEFEGLKGLIEVIMGSTVEQIGVRAFYNCLSLYKVKLSSNLKVIKYGAFENCRSLKGAIRLPITIEKIET